MPAPLKLWVQCPVCQTTHSVVYENKRYRPLTQTGLLCGAECYRKELHLLSEVAKYKVEQRRQQACLSNE